MSRWWRAYDEAVDDPKLILLTDKQFRAWFNLCCLCSQNGGQLPAAAAIGVKLRISTEKAKHLVAELVALGLIDANDGGASMHNWANRQYQSDSSTARVKRFRNARRNVTETFQKSKLKRFETVSVTAPDTESERIRLSESLNGKEAPPATASFRDARGASAGEGKAQQAASPLLADSLRARGWA